VAQEDIARASGASAAAAVAATVLGAWAFGLCIWLLAGPGLLLFPDGRLPGDRWRWALWVPLVLVTALPLADAVIVSEVCLQWSGDDCVRAVENPFQVITGADVSGVADRYTQFLFVGVLAVSLAALIVRYRRSRGEVRGQLKWVAWMAMAVVLVFFPVAVAEDLLGSTLNEWVGVLAFMVLTVGMPVAMAVAIFKYRLYDIDRIINRTAVYAIVVGLLAVVFAAGAVWIPSLLPFEESNLAVAASTLAVFFLFNPLRQRTQRFVDRRFYRSRYDAQQVADEFSARLRDQVDPDQVAAEWVEVVQRTLQPESVAVWVKEGT
jgi:hypothetical protein